jgi:hypothetical protein
MKVEEGFYCHACSKRPLDLALAFGGAMTMFAVEGSILVVRFSLREMTVSHHRTLRIPLSLVHSASVDPHPWGWLSQRLKVAKPPIPEELAKTADQLWGIHIEKPEDAHFEGGVTYVQGDLVKLVGPPGAQVFTRFNPQLPALRVDLTEAVPYIGFLVAHRDPAAAVADLSAAIRRVR